MIRIEQEINELRLEILQKQVAIKTAIRNGAIFDEVKQMTLQLKEFQQQLDKKMAAFSGIGGNCLS